MEENGITSRLKCPICMELFENPKHLPCGHDVCESCLKYHIIHTVPMVGYNIFDFLDGKTPDIKPSETHFKCPVDGKKLTPQNPKEEVSKWASQFENNLKIVSLIEICHGKVRGVIEYCDSCIELSQKVAASSVCFTCIEKYCVKCAFIHRHTHPKDLLFNLFAIQAVLGDHNLNASSSAEIMETCKIHLFCQVTFYCVDCHEKCCRTCKQTTHGQCKHVTRLHNGSGGSSVSLEQLFDRFEEVLSQILSSLKEDLELFEKVEEWINYDNGVKSRNLSSLIGSLQCQISRLELYHGQTKQSLRILNEMKQQPVKAKPNIILQMEIECQQLEKEIDCHRKFASDGLKKFTDIQEEQKHETKGISKVKLPNRRNKNLKRMHIDDFYQLVNFKTENSLADISKKVSLVDKVNMKTKHDVNNCSLTDCLYLKAGFLIVSDKGNRCIKWKLNNDQVNTLSLKSGPHCLAADKLGNSGCVTLPDDNMIQFFCITDDSIDFTHHVSTTEKCHGVDFIEDAFIAVTYVGNLESSVCILNREGTEVRRFPSTNALDEKMFCNPQYVKAQDAGDQLKLYVTDFRLGKVTCITLKELNGDFTTDEIIHSKMGNPLGVDIDDKGSLLVCCNSSCNVQQIVFSNEFERQHCLMLQYLWLPRSVSFLKGGNRFIVTSDTGPCKNYVNVYEITS